MSFIYNNLSSLWNTAPSYFPQIAKYCSSNNINWTTSTNLAKDVALLPVLAAAAAADKVGKAALDAVGEVANAAPALAYGAKDLVAQAAHKALVNTHAWQFGSTAEAPEKSSATMAAELAGAAGSKLLDFGYSALKSGYAMLSDKAMQAGSALWAEVQVQAPALGHALLQDAQHLAGLAADAAEDGWTVLSGQPMEFDAFDVNFDHAAVAQVTNLVPGEVLSTSVLAASLGSSAQGDSSAPGDDSDYFDGAQEVVQIDLSPFAAAEGLEEFATDYAALHAFEGLSMHNHLGHSATVMAY